MLRQVTCSFSLNPDRAPQPERPAFVVEMRLLRKMFTILLAVAGYVTISLAQVKPGRPVQPVPPGHPPGAPAPDGGDGLGSGDGAFLFAILFLLLLFGFPVLIVRTISWWGARRARRSSEIRRREQEEMEQERQERTQADNRRWNNIEERVQLLLEGDYTRHGSVDIDRVKRELRYSRWDITQALLPLEPFRAESVTISVQCPGNPSKGEKVELLYQGKQILTVDIPDVESTLWHIRNRSGDESGPISAAQLREITLKTLTRGRRISIVRSHRDSKWHAWQDAGREYPELILAGVVQA